MSDNLSSLSKRGNIGARFFGSAYLGLHAVRQPRYPFKPRAAIERDQSRNVRRMVVHAYRHVPYYREVLNGLHLKPSDFKTAADLARLPILERRQVQEAPEKFISLAEDISRCLVLRTGGSAGTPLIVYQDPRAVLKDLGHQQRYRAVLSSVIGKRLRYRETWILPLQSSPHKIRRYWRARTFLVNRVIPPKQYLSMYDPPETNVPLLNVFKPEAIQSYGSYIETLFAYLSAAETPFVRPKVLGFGGDNVSASARRMIKDKFGLECFSAYSSVEAWRIAFECPEHRGLHINEDLYPLRIVDSRGRTLPPGEAGDVVVSNLVNRAMVFLNYRLGDIASLLPGSCPCGRTLPLMSYPLGRSDDWIERPEGGPLHAQAVHTLLRDESEVWQYQVTQETLFCFKIALVVKDSCDREKTRKRVTANFKQAFGENAKVEVAFVPSIPRTEGGKVRPIVSLTRKA